jgi:peptide/nickel transport system substrate-binding protein
MKKFTKVLSVLLIGILLLVGCSQSSEPPAVDAQGTESPAEEPALEIKDTLALAHWQEPATLDPQFSNMISWFVIERQMFNNLIKENLDGTYSPELAESWELIDDKTIRFVLRDEVYFHNGEKLTAEDVYFSLDRGTKAPTSASTFKTVDIENTKVVDELTLDLALKIPDQAILNTLATGRGYIVNKKAVEEMGENEYARAPVGTGPYVFENWISGTEITMTRNDNYFAEPAKVEKLQFKFIPEAANRVIELETGGVDIAYSIDASDVNRIQELEGYDIVMGPSYRYTTLTMSMKDELLKDKRIRQALTYAIDKELLVEVVYGETAEVLNGVMPVNALGFKAMEATSYDVELAKELLAEAGYADGLDLTFLVEPGSEYENIAEVIQNMWKDIGVNTELVTMDRQSYLAQGNEYQVAIRAGNANHPSNILIIYDSAFGDRIQGNDPYIDETLIGFRQIYNDAERQAVLDDLQDYLWDIKYTIPVAHTNIIFGVSDKVDNFTSHPLGLMELSNMAVYQ